MLTLRQQFWYQTQRNTTIFYPREMSSSIMTKQIYFVMSSIVFILRTFNIWPFGRGGDVKCGGSYLQPSPLLSITMCLYYYNVSRISQILFKQNSKVNIMFLVLIIEVVTNLIDFRILFIHLSINLSNKTLSKLLMHYVDV